MLLKAYRRGKGLVHKTPGTATYSSGPLRRSGLKRLKAML